MKDRNIFRMGGKKQRTQKLSGKTLEMCALKGELKWLRTLGYEVKGNILQSCSMDMAGMLTILNLRVILHYLVICCVT
jgi:hypothetical protein